MSFFAIVPLLEQSDAITTLLKLKDDCKGIQMKKWKQPQQTNNPKRETNAKTEPNHQSLSKPVAEVGFDKKLQDIHNNENFSIEDESPSNVQETHLNSQIQPELEEETKVIDPEKAKIEKMIMHTQKEDDVDEQDIDEYLKNLEK